METILFKVKTLIRPTYKKLFPGVIEFLQKELKGCESVLDLGCGKDSFIQECDVPFKVGVEIFESYIEESKRKGIHNKYIKEDVNKVNFEPKSFDAIIMIDVLEHLTKEDGYRLLKKMEGWAKKKIIIFTPNGYIDNDHVDGNPLQGHKSGWSVDEFKKEGYGVWGANGWKALRGKGARFKFGPNFLAFVVSTLSQKVTYYFPRIAFHLFAVKKI